MSKSNSIWLSKSTLMQSFQCPKAIFLQKNYYQLRDRPSAETMQLFSEGRNIEEQAREQLFPGGINLQPKSPKQWATVAELTEQLIQNGQELIYEATFIADGVMCAVDVVRVISQKQIELYEIKRGSVIKEAYIKDVSIQYTIVSRLGYEIKSANLVHPLDPHQDDLIFEIMDVTHECQSRQDLVEEQIDISKTILAQSRIPDISRGEQCYNPYQCSFLGFCTQQEQLFED